MNSTRTFTLCEGAQFRLVSLMTHYHQPLDFSKRRVTEATTILNRWLNACIPCEDGPPIEILEAMCQDINTPRAISYMHTWRKQDGRKLFAAMRFLGFFNDGSCHVDEVKTIPKDHLNFSASIAQMDRATAF